MDKVALRQEIKSRLTEMTSKERVAASKAICRLIVDSQPFHDAAVVMVYLPLPHEVDTTPLILYAWQQGKTVAVPKVSWQQRHMIPVELTSLETDFHTDKMGLRTPTNGTPVPFEDIDLVVTPGLAFDTSGNRLGRGGGYYDRFFAGHDISAARWAVAFSTQLYPAVPHEDTDQRVDAIVTENEIINCAAARQGGTS